MSPQMLAFAELGVENLKNKGRVLKNIDIGMLGAALLVIAQWLLLSFGVGNQKNGIIESNWVKMPMSRFEAGIIVTAIGVPLYYIGIKEVIKSIRVVRRKRQIMDLRFAKIFECSAYASVIGFLFLHTVFVVLPITYKLLYETTLMGADIFTVVESIYYYLAVPFWIYLIISVAGMSISWLYFMWAKRLRCSVLGYICNPLFTCLLGFLLSLIKVPIITDFVAASAALGLVFMFAASISHVVMLPDDRELAKRRARRAARR